MSRLADPDLAARRRRQILEAAEACFRRKGFHQSTMQEICAEAQISPGAVYRYFDSKSDIIAAIAERRHLDSDPAFDCALRQGGPIEALQCAFGGFLAKIEIEHLGPVFADILSEAARDPALGKRLAQIGARRTQDLTAAIARAQAVGDIDPDLDPHEAAAALGAVIEGMGLRFATARAAASDALMRQFRTLAERYLAPKR